MILSSVANSPLLQFRKIQKSIRGGTSGLLYTHVKFGWTPVDYSNYAAANTLANAFKAFALTSLYRGDGLGPVTQVNTDLHRLKKSGEKVKERTLHKV